MPVEANIEGWPIRQPSEMNRDTLHDTNFSLFSNNLMLIFPIGQAYGLLLKDSSPADINTVGVEDVHIKLAGYVLTTLYKNYTSTC